jgi:membrane-associated phospholipid phosphatase
VRRDALLAALFAGLFAVFTWWLAAGGPLIDLDLAIQEWSETHRPPVAEAIAQVLNRLGQGGPLLGICVVLALLVGWVRWRSGGGRWPAVQPLLYVLAAAVLVVPTVLVVKRLTERGAPSSPLPPEETVPLMGPLPPGEYDAGYPSGHAVNTIVWYGVMAVLVACLLHRYHRPARWWTAAQPVFRIAPPLIVLASQTYLSYHWFTDSLAGFALGLSIDRILSMLRRLQ